MKSTRRFSPYRKERHRLPVSRCVTRVSIYTLRVLARCAYCCRTIKAHRLSIPSPQPLPGPCFLSLRMSAMGTFPFYWTVETSIARAQREDHDDDDDDDPREYIRIRIGWRAGTQNTLPGPRHIICMPVLTDSHSVALRYIVLLPYMYTLYVYRVYRKLNTLTSMNGKIIKLINVKMTDTTTRVFINIHMYLYYFISLVI